MSIAGLPTQLVEFPFIAGINGKAHAFALDPPGLSSAKNVEFDEVGALRLRKPYASVGSSIYPSGTIGTTRKIAVVGDELLLFTTDTLYSWSETLSKWVSKGTHLAVATTEATRFSNTTDQAFADRAQLSGIVVMVWVEYLAAASLSYYAVIDATTGAVMVAPTSLGAGCVRPRVVALDTKFLVTWLNGTSLYGATIDPTTLVLSGATSLSVISSLYYDIVKDRDADRAVYVTNDAGGAAYLVGRVTSALAVTTSTKVRTADGAIALSVETNTGRIQVVRQDGGDIKGDLLNLSSLADVFTNQAIGAVSGTLSQLTCAHRNDGALYSCYVFWGDESQIEYNTVDTAGTIGTEAVFLYRHEIGSRAFNYDGKVYLWTASKTTNAATGTTTLGFTVAMQDTNYLYRDDVSFHAKAVWQRGPGVGFYTNHLPGVALISGTTGFACATTARNFVALAAPTYVPEGGSLHGVADRSPRDITFTFDSDSARRVVQLGATGYVTGGIVFQYDGEGLIETGIEQFPYHIEAATGAAGALPAGQYSYKGSLRAENARGETERSTTAIGVQYNVAASKKIVWRQYRSVVTRRQGSRRKMSLEMWRTEVDPTDASPFYLITSRDPGVTGDNGYVENDPALVTGYTDENDNMTDAVLVTKEQHPENGGALPHLAPPPASIIVASEDRLFLAGIPGEPCRVVYSLRRGANEVVSFSGNLEFDLPSTTGPITGLALLSETLVVFTASAIYVVPGEGFDNTGGGFNYGPPRLISSDIGSLSHDTIATTPGGLVFFSRKGWHRLSPGWDLEYIGAKVEDFNTDTWVAAQVVESQHQVRLLSSSRMLMFDYNVGEWSEWDQASGKDLAMWRASPMLLDSAVKKEQSTFSAVDYYMEIVTGWIKPAGLQGFARLRRILVLGQYKADHAQSVAVGFDYAPSYTDSNATEFFVAANAALVSGAPTQLRHGPSRQRIESFRVRITIVPAASGSIIPLTYDAVTLVGLALEVGIRKGPYPRIAAIYKQ